VTLHLFSTSPANVALLDECCAALRAGDTLLLLGEGVHAAAAGSLAAQRLESLPADVTVCALDEDSVARGLKPVSARIVAVNYAGFVALACEHARSVSWF
jgi:tRNA 2-thiouridine synthesizing protein B